MGRSREIYVHNFAVVELESHATVWAHYCFKLVLSVSRIRKGTQIVNSVFAVRRKSFKIVRIDAVVRELYEASFLEFTGCQTRRVEEKTGGNRELVTGDLLRVSINLQLAKSHRSEVERPVDMRDFVSEFDFSSVIVVSIKCFRGHFHTDRADGRNLGITEAGTVTVVVTSNSA